MKLQIIPFTTNTAGAATSWGDTLVGKVYSVAYLPGDTDTGATVTLTAEGDMSHPVLVKTTAGTSNVVFYPRSLVHGNTDGAALTGTSGGDRAQPFVAGKLKLVIASGGAVKTGKVIVLVDE